MSETVDIATGSLIKKRRDQQVGESLTASVMISGSSTGGGIPGSLTAAQILASLVTVDGSGSGLDADKLDGHEASYFQAAGSYAQISGTPADNYIAVWTGAQSIEGTSSLTFDGHILSIDPNGTAGYIFTRARYGGTNHGNILANNGTGNNFILAEIATSYYSIGYGTIGSAPTNVIGLDFVNARIGIGTTNPLTLFHIYGSASTGSYLDSQTKLLIDGTEGRVQIRSADDGTYGSGIILTTAVKSWALMGLTTTGSNKFQIGYRSSSAGEDILSTSTKYLTIQSDGNVGLGTTSPTTKLHLYSAGDNRIYVQSDTMYAQLGAVIGYYGFVGTVTADDFTIRTNDINRMYFQNSTGNIGIGCLPSYKLDVNGTGRFVSDVRMDGNIGSDPTSFVSGFNGTGWKNEINTGISTLTVDNLVVRMSMKIYELVINQIRASNGSIWISDCAKVNSVTELSGPLYKCYIDDDDGNISQPFVAYDIVRCQKFTGRGVKYYTACVVYNNPTGGDYFTLNVIHGSDVPEAGDDVVRIGNVTNSARRGSLYMTASDNNSPYIDIMDGVTDESFAGHIKVRIGNLSGITDVDFGGLLGGYGLYGENVYLKGVIRASSGAIGGWNINSTSIYTGTEDHSGYTANAGDITIYSSGTAASIHAKNFYIDINGNLNAVNATLSGTITSSAGTIGGFTLSSTALTGGSAGAAGWCTIDSSNGLFGISRFKSYCYSQQSSPVTLSDPVPYIVALDNNVESTLNLPATGLPSSGTAAMIFIIHQYGTGLGSGKYHIQGNGYYIINAGSQVSSIDLDEGHSLCLVWEPRSMRWYVISKT